jgi:hypothetical protein
MELPATSPATRQALLHLWSDPLAHAHAAWLARWPAELVALASHEGGARRTLTRWLRETVPLPPLDSVEGEPQVPWAMGSRREIFRKADEAGLILMRYWVVRAVARRDVQSVMSFLGREHYEAALASAPELWLDTRARPELAYDLPEAVLQQAFRGLGFRALDGALAERLEVFRGRMRLLAGPDVVPGMPSQPLPVDHDLLLSMLRADALAEQEDMV